MASTGLTALERQVLRCYGLPARDVARALRVPVNTVMDVRRQLRERGAVPVSPALSDARQLMQEWRDGQDERQLSFDDLAYVMRANRAPQTPGAT